MGMKIYIEDKIIVIKFRDEEEEKLTKDHFTFDNAAYAFVGGTFDQRKIKKVCFLKKKNEFYLLGSGFLYDLLNFVKENDFLVNEFKDNRSGPIREFHDTEYLMYFPKKFKYIEHQLESLKKMTKTTWGIIEAPTSSGKSETIIAYLRLMKLPALILVNRISLAMQLADRMTDNGIENVGLCYGGAFKNGDVVVSTIGSVKKIPDLHKFKVLIIDEVHRAQSKQFQDFLSKAPYPLRFGFSATPDSGDKYKWALIRQYMGDIIYRVEADMLVEKEVIALPKIKFIQSQCVPTTNWPDANDQCIVGNDFRNNSIRAIINKHMLPTLVLIRNIEHGEKLRDIIPGSVFVSGIDNALTRKEVIEDFENGELEVIISSNIFNEGISINAIKVLIIASGGKSKIETIQKLGRGLRITEDKKEVFVYDFEDEGNRFTERHSHIRKKIYQKIGFEVK